MILIGFMGTGKTTVGRHLADRLGYEYQDTDCLIEAVAGESISLIFETRGELAFRNLESKALASACQKSNSVISTGGGVVIDRANRELMRRSGTVVWLQAHPEVIVARIASEQHRPLLSGTEQPLDRIRELVSFREDAYAEASHFTITTDNLTSDEVSERVVASLNNENQRSG